MKYLSIDIESTGLENHAQMIEFACVPVDTTTEEIRKDLAYHSYVKCPSFKELEPTLNDFVKKNNKAIIDKAHKEGLTLPDLQMELTEYVQSPEIKAFFYDSRPVLMGKSLSALDIPILQAAFGREYLTEVFHHQVLDITSVARSLVEAGVLPPECSSSSKLAQLFLDKKDVDHTALGDSVDMAKIYIKILNKLKESVS